MSILDVRMTTPLSPPLGGRVKTRSGNRRCAGAITAPACRSSADAFTGGNSDALARISKHEAKPIRKTPMPTHATTEEILEAFRTLTKSEYEALAGAAAFLMRGSRFSEPADLISETMNLLLDGRRNWPTMMEFGPFMFATMRSVADSDRQLQESHRIVSVCIEDMLDCAGNEFLHTPSVEDQLLAEEPARLVAQAAMAASAELDGDDDAKHVLESIFEGMTRDQACKSFDIAPSTYDNARKRAYRKIRKCIDARMH